MKDMDIWVETLNSVSSEIGNGTAAKVAAVAIILIIVVLFIAMLFFVLWLLLKLNRRIFSRFEKKHGKQLQFQFLEKCLSVALVVVIIVVPLAGDRISQSLLGSTAVIAAVAGIAAQDVLKDVFSGLMISIYKPFDIGDRIELEDGTVGIVESITMRHVVIVLIDTVRLVIPNSKLNNIPVHNYSYGNRPRSILFRFPVSYDSDIEKTKKVIFDTVRDSPYSIEGINDKTGENEYLPVYFIDIEESALIMSVTVFYSNSDPTWIVKDDINSRVFAAFKKNDIEVPYSKMNVILNDNGGRPDLRK